MKLTKHKVGLLSLAIVLSVGMLLGVNSAVLATTTHTLEDPSDFQALTGNYLSEQGIETGDIIELDFAEVTQTTSLIVDVDVTIKPSDNFDTVVLKQGDSDVGDWDGGFRDEASDDNLGAEVDAAIVVLANGVTLDSLEFKPHSPFTTDYSDFIGPANAIEVDCCVFDANKSLRLYNLAMPVAGSNGGFINGVKFDGSFSGTSSCGIGGLEYDGEGIHFRDVRIEGENGDGIHGNGVVFTEEVGDVANVHFEEFFAGEISEYDSDWTYPPSSGANKSDPSDSGNGILFNNNGTVKNVTLTKSERTSPSVSELPYALKSNASNGILINGQTVTEVSGLELNYTRLEDNTGAGIFVRGEYKEDPISSLGMTVKNTLIKDNNYGILVATGKPTQNLTNQGYSPIKIDGLHLGENLTVHDNQDGGALFKVQVVKGSKSSPGLTVTDSQFHRDKSDTDSETNSQDFGLMVDAYEGISGVEISDSTFRYHGNTQSGAGIELLTPGTEDYYDQIEEVTIENTSSQHNAGPGLQIAANVVEDIDILNSGSSPARFSSNNESGIVIDGQDRVNFLKITGEAGGGEILANSNDKYGLLVESEEEIYGVEVANAQFGDELNDVTGNGKSGVRLATTGSESDYNIGSDKSEGAISFDNVEASGNDEYGIEIDAAGSFINPSDTILVNNSEFWENQLDGLHLYANENVKRPRVEISTFAENNVSGGNAGLYIQADGDKILGTGDGDIVGNVVAGNEIGIAVYDPTTDSYVDTIIDFSVKGNTTVHPDDSDKNGNRWANVVLAAETLNTVAVEDNHLVSAYTDDEEEPNTDYGLWLEANDSSASLSVTQNRFDSGAEGFCVGIGTGILLDAKKTTVKLNEIDGFKTAIDVLQESSDSSTADDTSNHINRNNILGCCTLMDASALDYANGEKVDATDNYWGKDVTKSDLKPNMKSDSSNPWDQIFVEPLRDEPVEITGKELEINISITPKEPDVNETVELEYELVNNTGTIMNLDEVLLTVTDADEEYIEQDKVLETDVSIPGNDSKTFTYEFDTTNAKGDYTAEITADDYTPESKTFEVGVIAPGEKKPFWGDSANAAESGILPAPINSANDETPFLDLANEKGDSVLGYVTINAVNVFDRTGKRLLKIESDFQNMTQLEKLNNDLYAYTVDYTLDDGTKKTSPVMKFVVNNE